MFIKRAIILVTVPIISLTAASCGKNAEEKISLPKEFTVNAEINENDFIVKSELTRKDGGWIVSVSEPKTLEGMQLSITDKDCTVNYKELSYSSDLSDFPSCSALRLTLDVLDKCTSSKSEGKIYGEEYEVEFKDGKLSSAAIGDGITVKFSKFKA